MHYRVSPVGPAVGEPSGPPGPDLRRPAPPGAHRRRPAPPPSSALRRPRWRAYRVRIRRQREPAGAAVPHQPGRDPQGQPAGRARLHPGRRGCCGSRSAGAATAPAPPASPAGPTRTPPCGPPPTTAARWPTAGCRPGPPTRALIERTARRYGVDPGARPGGGLAGVRLEPAAGLGRQRHRRHAGRPGHRARGPPAWSAAGWTCSDPADNVTAGRRGAARPAAAARPTPQAVAGYYQGLASVQAPRDVRRHPRVRPERAGAAGPLRLSRPTAAASPKPAEAAPHRRHSGPRGLRRVERRLLRWIRPSPTPWWVGCSRVGTPSSRGSPAAAWRPSTSRSTNGWTARSR